MALSVMNGFFLTILSLSLSSALTGMLILAIRPLSGKFFSRKWNYYIWFLVILRLLMPVQLTAALPGGVLFDLSKEAAGEISGESDWETDSMQRVETGKTDSMQRAETGKTDDIPSSGTSADGEAHTGMVHQEAENPTGTVEDADAVSSRMELPEASEYSLSLASVILLTVEIIWLSGVVAALGMKLWNYRRYLLLIKKDAHPVADSQIMVLAQSMSARLHLRRVPSLYESASVSGPVTVGLWKPVIILPETKCDAVTQNLSVQYQLILHHELVHVARRDLWYKWLYQLLLCIHWFNPFLYLFGRKMNMDCELSCDEAVLAELTAEGRRAYGNVLLDIAEQDAAFRANAFATTFVTGESGLKKRLNAILHYQKNTVSRLLLSVCVMAGAMFLTACGSIYFYDSSFEEHFDSDDEFWSDDFADEGRGFWDDFMEIGLTNKSGEAYQVYDDVELLSGADLSDKWQAYNYIGGGDKVTISRFSLNGSYSIRIVYADEDTDIEVASSFDLRDGRFKIIHVLPDGSVETINDTGEEGSTTVTMQKGHNVIKIVGQAAVLKNVEIRFSGLDERDFAAVYYSEEDEYAGQLMEAVKSGTVEKDKFMECLFYIEEE
ncbi:MAG: M56 family metallopeptidase, partial [Lachnospiraceae bacterium]|nr:M56 family metallopeptidase [Lachnospiraceae bacterium]